jgi:hypothetical protein
MMTIAPPRRRFARTAIAAAFMVSIAAPMTARAGDFPNDVKRTFTTDIPHFFQDDIPCTFGGQPTSGTRSSCKGPSHPAATPPKATAHKKKRSTTKPPAAHTPPSDAASAGAAAGTTADTPPSAVPGYHW